MSATDNRLQRLQEAQAAVNQILLGKDHQVNLAFCCLLARGHLLIEDVPGVGKTTLAHAMARVIGSDYQRIQFTSDLLPADILGVSIYKREKDVFELHPGPIFSQVILADEINRATPKTQSALLQAMEERRVTIAGILAMQSRVLVLDEPFSNLDYNGTRQVLENILRIGFGEDQAARVFIAQTVGAHADLLVALFPGHVQHLLSVEFQGHLKHEGGFPNAGFPADQHNTAGHQPATQHPVQFLVQGVNPVQPVCLYLIDLLGNVSFSRFFFIGTCCSFTDYLLHVGVPFPAAVTLPYPFCGFCSAVLADISGFAFCHSGNKCNN